MTLIYIKQVCLQLPATADKVALPASTAERRAAARLLLTAGPPVVQQSLDISWLAAGHTAANPRNSGVRRPDGRNGQTDKRTDRQTDGRTPDRCIDPAPHYYWQCRNNCWDGQPVRSMKER